MSLQRSASKSKFVDTPESSDIEPSAKRQASSMGKSKESEMQISEPTDVPTEWTTNAQLKPAVIVDYISHAVCDPDLPTSTKRSMYQALMMNKAAAETGQANNAYINMQLASAAGASLYGPQYAKWIQASYQGTTMGLPPPPVPAMTLPSTSGNRGRKNRPKGRGRAKNN